MSMTFADSIQIAADPRRVYDLVSDVTRTGEWSPICYRCEWTDASQTGQGATFVGHNRTADREWHTTSTVTVAEPGEEFSWVVGDDIVRWGYQMRAVDGGTELTETWELPESGVAFFHERFGDQADAQIENRRQAAHDGIPRTLAAIKRIAEGA